MSDIAGQTDDATPFDHRFTPLRRLIRPGTLGIEIGPFLNPLAAKRDGYRTLVVDRYDQAALREKARERGAACEAIERIEPVDYVGDASRLLDLVRGQGFTGQVDWIVSCHNFEHLPDPIRFAPAAQYDPRAPAASDRASVLLLVAAVILAVVLRGGL